MNTQLVWLTVVCARAQHPDIRASSAIEAAAYADRVVDEFLIRYGEQPPKAASKRPAAPEIPPLPAIPSPTSDFAATELSSLSVGDSQLDEFLEVQKQRR